MCWRRRGRLTKRERAIADAIQHLPPTMTDGQKDGRVVQCRICFARERLVVSHIHGLLCESCLVMYKGSAVS